MPQTTKQYHANLRALLHDTGEGYSTRTLNWSPDELIRATHAAREQVVTALIERGARTVLNRLIGVVSGVVSGTTSTPTGFYRAIIGLRTTSGTNHWVYPDDFKIAETMLAQGMDTLFAKAGKLYGTATTVYFWKMPSEALAPGSAEFSELPDAVMNCVQTLSARILLMNESSDVAFRAKALEEIFKRQFATLE